MIGMRNRKITSKIKVHIFWCRYQTHFFCKIVEIGIRQTCRLQQWGVQSIPWWLLDLLIHIWNHWPTKRSNDFSQKFCFLHGCLEVQWRYLHFSWWCQSFLPSSAPYSLEIIRLCYVAQRWTCCVLLWGCAEVERWSGCCQAYCFLECSKAFLKILWCSETKIQLTSGMDQKCFGVCSQCQTC